MPRTKKKQEHKEALAEFQARRDATADCLAGSDGVASCKEWPEFLSRDPLFTLADPATRNYLIASVELSCTPSQDSTMREIHRASAYYRARRGVDAPPRAPHPLVVLAFARWKRLYIPGPSDRQSTHFVFSGLLDDWATEPQPHETCSKRLLHHHLESAATGQDGNYYVHRGEKTAAPTDLLETCGDCGWPWMHREHSPPPRVAAPPYRPRLLDREIKNRGDGIYEISEVRGDNQASTYAASRLVRSENAEYGATGFITRRLSEAYRTGFTHPLRPQRSIGWHTLSRKTASRNVAAWALYTWSKVSVRGEVGVFSYADLCRLLPGLKDDDHARKAVVQVQKLIRDVGDTLEDWKTNTGRLSRFPEESPGG